MIIDVIFWTSFTLLAYTFVGYPLIIKILASKIGKQTQQDDAFLPSVSIILSVFNEEEVIEAKIANFLALDYPTALLELVIISDYSSDRTDELIQKHANQRIHLLIQSERSGKTRNLNRGVTEAQGDILVFTDANAMFDRDAIKNLVRHFVDPTVGLVSGKSMYLNATGASTSGSVYRRYEDFIKGSECKVGGIIGADGAIYAFRKSCYSTLIPEHINDFIHTIQVILAGKLAINDEEAICKEEVDDGHTGSSELHRQTRIMAQSWLIFLSQFGPLLKNGKILYLWQFISHKFLRWLTLPLATLLFGTNICLVKDGFFYQALFVGQFFFILSIVVGRQSECKIFRIPYFFALLHYAALLGLKKILAGENYTTWNPRNN